MILFSNSQLNKPCLQVVTDLKIVIESEKFMGSISSKNFVQIRNLEC